MERQESEHRTIRTNGVNLHVVRAGPEKGMLIILLHGFPEFCGAWHEHIPLFTAAGYRVWCPDQRGYNLSDKPESIAAYALDELVADVLGLIDVAGEERAIIIGHDWGATVAWWLSIRYPSRIHKLVVLNAPHPKVLRDHLHSNISQLLRSWYIFFFQLPKLPELIAQIHNYQPFVWALRWTARPDTFSDRDIAAFRQAWSRPGAFPAMLKWYKALVQHSPDLKSDVRVRIPTLIIWGTEDAFFVREMAELSTRLCDNCDLFFIERATHWVHHEEVKQVNELIINFLKDNT